MIELLERLGVDRWDTFPTDQGRIRFSRGDRVVAVGRYRVVLTWGPGDEYTMGWAIPAYRAAGIPFVEREQAPGPDVVRPATRAQAQRRGEEVLARVGGGFLYWCSTLLVLVSDLQEVDAPATAVDLAERLDGLSRAVAHRREPRDAPLSGPEKRALFDEIRQLGPRKDLETALVFVIEAAEQEVELSRSLVTASDVGLLARIYWMLPTWAQRTCLVHLVSNHDSDALRRCGRTSCARPTCARRTGGTAPRRSPWRGWTGTSSASWTTSTTTSARGRRRAGARRMRDP